VKIQCRIRCKIAFLYAAKLRQQQASEWEQLWNDREGRLYYFNRITQTSTYEDPMELYRPLVRDRLSDRLVQAWPFLDELDAMSRGGMPPLPSFAPSCALPLPRCCP
jgi:hypothetical protein